MQSPLTVEMQRELEILQMTEQNKQKLVFKVGTSSLTHEGGRINLDRVEKLVTVLADLCNMGHRVALVTSGAIGVGTGKLGLSQKPSDVPGRQAAATVGQCELMFLYDKFFTQFGHKVGQLLITKEDMEDEKRYLNLTNTFAKLFDFGAIPIINENDAVATEEIVYGDNDTLSAMVACVIKADKLIILTETDGLYDSNPQDNPSAKHIDLVANITQEVLNFAGDSKTSMGTGGMKTKLRAATIATNNGIDTYIIAGQDPKKIYDLLEGKQVGTLFLKQKQ